MVVKREEREERARERERSYLKEGLEEQRGKEPEDVNVKLVGVIPANVISVHLDEASNLISIFRYLISTIIYT